MKHHPHMGAFAVLAAVLLFLLPKDVRASPAYPTPEEAAFFYREELDHSWYSMSSENIFVTIRKFRSESAEYYLTHVIIRDPSQIQSALANGTFGGDREKPSDASKRLGWVVGINGSNFSWESGNPQYAGICIKRSL